MKTSSQIPENSFHANTRSEWRSWLRKNHPRGEGVWLITYKKPTGKPHLCYNDAVEEALCFGWVDSKPRKLDAERSMLYFAPRKPRTGWSKANKERVERLIAADLMMPSGRAKVETAKRDGSWSALDAVEKLEVPADLHAALSAYRGAEENWNLFPRSVKRGILEWINNAKRAETRAKRIDEVARKAGQNVRANQWPR